MIYFFWGKTYRRKDFLFVKYDIDNPVQTKPQWFPLLVLLFSKPTLLQESRFTGGGSLNLVDLIEWLDLLERKMGAAYTFHSFYP